MKKITIVLCFYSIISFTVSSKEASNSQGVEDYFEYLSHDSTDFEPMGNVCERVALKEVEALYPTALYDIKNGMEYNERNATIGELDLVMINRNTGKAEAVAEVKCWRSLQGGLKKAKEQRMRFLNYLNRNIVLKDMEEKTYSKDIFSNIQKFFSISQRGGVSEGFDFELSLDFKELMDLRKKLLDCRVQGHCPK
jgi:hypothetical protein